MARDLDDRYPDWETFSLDLAEVFRTENFGAMQAEFADADKFEMLRKISFSSDSCRHKFDRAFMQILVERLTMANIRLSGV